MEGAGSKQNNKYAQRMSQASSHRLQMRPEIVDHTCSFPAKSFSGVRKRRQWHSFLHTVKDKINQKNAFVRSQPNDQMEQESYSYEPFEGVLSCKDEQGQVRLRNH